MERWQWVWNPNPQTNPIMQQMRQATIREARQRQPQQQRQEDHMDDEDDNNGYEHGGSAGSVPQETDAIAFEGDKYALHIGVEGWNCHRQQGHANSSAWKSA